MNTKPENISDKTWEARGDPDRPLLITQIPAEPLLAANALPITLSTAEAIEIGAEGAISLHPSIVDNFQFKLRRFYLGFAPDMTSSEVRRAVIQLGILLHNQTADVRILKWEREKGDLQQFLSNPGTGEPALRLTHLYDTAGDLPSVLQVNDREMVEHYPVQAHLSEGTLKQLCRMFARPLKTAAASIEEVVQEAIDEQQAAKDLQEMAVEAWLDSVDGPALVTELIALVEEHMIMTRVQSTATVFWTLLTYFVDTVDVLPLLSISSPEKRCGKTNLLFLLGRLANRPLTAGNISTAAIYRVVERYAPTLLVDEVDTWLRHNEPARGILNAGHTRDGAFIYRAHGPTGVVRFSTWCPKALAGIGKLSETLADRSIPISLHRRAMNDREVKRLNDGAPTGSSFCTTA